MQAEGIVLGVGAPQQSKKHGKTLCAILLTEELGLIRVYPVPAGARFPVWGKVSVSLEPSSDPRAESYRLRSFRLIGKETRYDHKRAILESCVLRSGLEDPIDYQNSHRKSIALVRLPWGKFDCTLSTQVPKQFASEDEEFGWVATQGEQWQKPYLTWASQSGKAHKTHLGGREIYMGLQHFADNPFRLFESLNLTPDYEHWLLLGNLKNQRNVWLCVHLHRLKKREGGSILPCCAPGNGKPDDWPYSTQEAENVSSAAGQLEMSIMCDMI